MEAPPEGGGVGRTGAIGTGFLNRMLKKSASSVLDTREASFVPGFGHFTLHERRGRPF